MKVIKDNKMLSFIKQVIENVPADWLNLTTHRLDIYDENLRKIEFLDQFENLFEEQNAETTALQGLPTAFDYIRLGHPLSCVLEWAVARVNCINAKNVISFSSKTMPILAVLRKNLLANKRTRILYTEELPSSFDLEILRHIYGYKFELKQVKQATDISELPADQNWSTIFISQKDEIFNADLIPSIDFYVNIHAQLGSIIIVNGEKNEQYISAIQHVRRRESIAMTPDDAFIALKYLIEEPSINDHKSDLNTNKSNVLHSIAEISGLDTKVLVGSSGLSIQYAIMMGLIHDAKEKYDGKDIKIIIPPNCYGGTNDQARRIAACVDHVEVLDLLVDGGKDMVQSIDSILNEVAAQDAIPYIIAEIPTNPRVEVPDLEKLKNVLSASRKTLTGELAIAPVFILDQTFCPNVHFLGEGEALSSIKTIAYVSGSKFPSGGLCTAGHCVANEKAKMLMDKVEAHLQICDNEATALQYKILAKQLPSMNQRIIDAYKNTRKFVNFIYETLTDAKINFVSDELAIQGFTPSVFSLDLPTKGANKEEREIYKRKLNLKLINLMIKEIPHESKFCVSYGQLKGCYWTIPATSTQGTTKEDDKDYIVRVALSAHMDLELHKKVFLQFVAAL